MLQVVAATGAYVAGVNSTQIFIKRLLSMPFPFPGCPYRGDLIFFTAFCKIYGHFARISHPL
jgi:hypothetical protein